MSSTKQNKIERVEFRVEPEVKAKIQTAADFCGEKMSDFILSRVMVEVERLIESEREIKLSQETWEGFVNMLHSPKPASKSLKKSMKKYLKTQEG